MNDDTFNQMFTIKESIKEQYHKEIQEFLGSFIDNYKLSLESAYIYLEAQPCIALLGQIKRELPNNTRIQSRFITETIALYVIETSLKEFILSLSKLLEEPQPQHQAENRSFYNLFLRGSSQGYISNQLKAEFDSLKAKEKILFDKLKKFRNRIAHSIKDFNRLSLWEEQAFSNDEIKHLIKLIEAEISDLYYKVMSEICPDKYSQIQQYKDEPESETVIIPKNFVTDLGILSKVYEEYFEFFKIALDITLDPKSTDQSAKQILKDRSKDFYSRLFDFPF